MPKPFAYVTLVMLSDSYMPGALVLGHQLKKLSPHIDRICMVTPQVSPKARSVLAWTFNQVIEVTPWLLEAQEGHRHDWSSLFTKLECLTFTQYQKLLFIDADILPLADYQALFNLKPPAGILNETKDHFVKASTREKGLLAWHDAYQGLCPHGAPIPEFITNRIASAPDNLGVNSCLWLLAPSKKEHAQIATSLKTKATRAFVNTLALPEMQFMTYYWSGKWSNIDIRFAAFNCQPGLEYVYGTHFAGLKPWQWQRGISHRHYMRLPDYQLWSKTFMDLYKDLPLEYRRMSRLKKIAQCIRALG